MNQEENPTQEPVSTPQPVTQTSQQEAPNPTPRLNEAKLESAHAELPPLSVVGASSERSTKPGTIVAPKQFGRRGVPRSIPTPALGQVRPSIGVIEDPTQVTESLSGSAANQRKAQPRPEQGNRQEQASEPHAQPGRQPGIPQGDRPNREAHRTPHREPREARPSGHDSRRELGTESDVGPSDERSKGHPSRNTNSGDVYDRPERTANGPYREPRETRPSTRQPRSEPRPAGERPRREPRPRIQIDPVVIPIQAPIGFWPKLSRKLATLFGIPEKAEFVPVSQPTPPPQQGSQKAQPQRSQNTGGGDSRNEGRGGPRRGRGQQQGFRNPRNGPPHQS